MVIDWFLSFILVRFQPVAYFSSGDYFATSGKKADDLFIAVIENIPDAPKDIIVIHW